MRISGAPGEPPQIQAECLGLSDPGTALLLRVNRACLGPLRATQDQGGYRVATGWLQGHRQALSPENKCSSLGRKPQGLITQSLATLGPANRTVPVLNGQGQGSGVVT